jgi:hypothetical protein
MNCRQEMKNHQPRLRVVAWDYSTSETIESGFASRA